jgi:hypothetical protein
MNFIREFIYFASHLKISFVKTCWRSTVGIVVKCNWIFALPGGCLIATATYGSELATQVQLLREIRDNTILSTKSGTSFMTAFNSFYYSFSPTAADWERENPVFKEMVKVAITPLLSSLSLLQYVHINSDAQMLGYGIGIILLNIGMYFVAPALIIFKLKNGKKSH